MIIASLGLGDLLWSLLVILFMVSYWIIVFRAIVDVFHRDATGAKKAAWLIILLILPVVGLIAYLVTDGGADPRRAGKRG